VRPDLPPPVRPGADRRLRRAPGLVKRVVAGEVLLVPVRGELARQQQILVLNEVGAFVWDLLDGTRDLEALLAMVIEEFEVEPDQAHADLESFTTTLVARGLAEAVPEGEVP
jgi:hypothetical protein